MKKFYLMMAAVSALALTACTSEDDFVQDAPTTQVAADQAVGFDVYTPAVTNATRAGLQGTMTTSRLQRSEAKGGGFGVYAYLTEDEVAAAGYGANATAYGGRTTPVLPNFMVNEKLLWNATNQGWYYNPLKYWPNETDNDSQNSEATMETAKEPYAPATASRHIDRLTFFAYAPYVNPSTITATDLGITGVTNNLGKLTYGSGSSESNDPTGTVEASIKYTASLSDPNKAVDLLWGVAPAGGLTYTAVNGTTVNVPEGQPLIDMTKPDVNTNMKFLFQHALARIGIKAVAAIDQVSAGGTLDPNTRITIKSIKLTGYFGQTGLLNLDNTNPSVANWRNINNVAIGSATTTTNLVRSTITIDGNYIAEHLRFVAPTAPAKYAKQADRVGVTTIRQNVIEPNDLVTNPDWFSEREVEANQLAYSETTPYYDANNAIVNVTMPASYTVDSKGIYTEVAENTSFHYPMVLENFKKATGFEQVTPEEASKGTYDNYQAYNKVGDDYFPKTEKPVATDYVVKDGIYFYQLVAANKDAFAGKQLYTKETTTYTPKAVGATPAAGDYVICGQKTKYVPFYAAGTYRMRDANYFMVIPTNNIENIATSIDKEALRTVRVEIEYYITTEDSELNEGRAQTKNVITKDVVFPSLANGKSYNLNLILGLTSVKMEAEVDDWKVINVNADLPQNTAE